jgi:type II secretory pathway pseudopilin PulG
MGEKGYSVTELLLVLILIGWVGIITVPNIFAIYTDYKLTTATRQLATAIQFARSKAVSENYDFNITLSGTNSYQISGGEIDSNANGTPEPWEDRNNDGTINTKTYRTETFTSGIVYVPDVSVYLSGGSPLIDTAPSPPTTFPTTTTTDPLTFEPLGSLISSSETAIFLRNNAYQISAVTVTKSGKIQSWRLEKSVWVKL